MKRIKILLVDDEKAFVDTLAQRLAMRNFDVEIAYDGAQAVERLTGRLKMKESRPDVLVLDVKMPGIGGIEVLRWLRGVDTALPVLIMSGYSSEKDEAVAEKLGVSEFLKKPPEFDHLIKCIARVCKKDNE
jgi:DNA-binding response OmpR family regulator